MCGIVAVLRRSGAAPVDPHLLRLQTDTLRHRGPDDGDVWVDPSGRVGLGHRRLSIIDLSPAGRQPMPNEDGTLWLSFNGEIYNFQRLREELAAKGHVFRSATDSEVVLHGYEEWGVSCLDRLEGMWAFVLWDGTRNRLFAARDRLGLKPLVYSWDQTQLVCASEVKAILADPAVSRDLDPQAIHHYLSFMNVPAPLTIWQNLRKLPPGHLLLADAESLKVERYWRLPTRAVATNRSLRDLLDELEEKLQQAVRARLIADVPVGVFLSGGLDSSLIAALAQNARSQDDPLHTFSLAFEGLGAFDETIWAKRVADHIGSHHRTFDAETRIAEVLPELVSRFDEPFAVSSAVGVHVLARQAGKSVKVVLTGDGGDEVFAGYAWRHTLLDAQADRLDRLPLQPFRRGAGISALNLQPVRWKDGWSTAVQRWARLIRLNGEALRLRRYLNAHYTFNEAEKQALYTAAWSEQQTWASSDTVLLPHLRPEADRLNGWLGLDLHTSLPDHMLVKVDQATMTCGLEARVPLLDPAVVSFARSLPRWLRAQGLQGKIALKRLAERYLPQSAVYRPKHGFNIPMERWLVGGLSELAQSVLHPDRLQAEGIFRPETVTALLTRLKEHPGPALANQVYSLLVFELWRVAH